MQSDGAGAPRHEQVVPGRVEGHHVVFEAVRDERGGPDDPGAANDHRPGIRRGEDLIIVPVPDEDAEFSRRREATEKFYSMALDLMRVRR